MQEAKKLHVVKNGSESETSAGNVPALAPEIMEKLVLHGDLAALNPVERIQYYNAICERLGLDPVTQPFKLLSLSGKLVLYCDRSGAQQLCKLHNVSHQITNRETVSNCYIVQCRAYLPNGRQTESIGAVALTYPDTVWNKQQRRNEPHPKAGRMFEKDDLCNALMKAETKAKRRATLDLLGLGMLDETETSTIPNARKVPLQPQPVSGPAAVSAPVSSGSGLCIRISLRQISLLRKLIKSHVFSEEERGKVESFIKMNPSSQKASKFIDSLKSHLEIRKTNEKKKQEAEPAQANTDVSGDTPEDSEPTPLELRQQAKQIEIAARYCDNSMDKKKEDDYASRLYEKADAIEYEIAKKKREIREAAEKKELEELKEHCKKWAEAEPAVFMYVFSECQKAFRIDEPTTLEHFRMMKTLVKKGENDG